MFELESIKNKIFNEDVLTILRQIPDDSIDMVYGDPDYNVGINYHGMKYTKKWKEYIDWYIELNKECLRVLKSTGNLFMINYPKQNSYLRVKYLDDNAYSVNDYVWVYNTMIGLSSKRFTTAHRSILHATKSKNNNFYKDNVAMPYKNINDKRIQERIKNGSKGAMPYSWFYFNIVKNVSAEKTEHPCQIPTSLSSLLIKASTKENDTVFVLFGGSGSEIMVCKSLNRNFISCELNKKYCSFIRDRLNKPSAEYGEEWMVKVLEKISSDYKRN